MSDTCIHERSYPATRYDMECGECDLGRPEYSNGCENCPEKYSESDAMDRAIDDYYSARSGG